MEFSAPHSHQFAGRRCRACQFEIAAEDPIAVDLDEDVEHGERTMTAAVEHWRCYAHTTEAVARAYEQAAGIADSWPQRAARTLREVAAIRRRLVSVETVP